MTAECSILTDAAQVIDDLRASLTSTVKAAHQIAQEMQVQIASDRRPPLHVIERWAEAILALGTTSSAILPVDGK